MNVRLLRKVKKHILEEPLRYDQNATIYRSIPGTYYAKGRKYPECGTVACIGGWIAVLTGAKPRLYGVSFYRIARQLAVPYSAVSRLCAYTSEEAEGEGWPARFRRRYERAARPSTKAKIAAEVIEFFIKTKGTFESAE